jgi:oligopeptide transport system ATP-binding protein
VTATMPVAPDARASGSAASGPLVEVEDLRVYFPIREGLIRERHVGDVRAVDDVSFQLRRGETLGLVGESGCGKSTTGRAMLRLYEPTAGRVRFDGIDVLSLKSDGLRLMRRRMQMIFQDPYASLNPRMTVNGIVGEPLEIHGEGGSSEERHERVREVLTTVGLNPEYGNRYPHEFSGGQRQRIGIARALALSPELIVADEPISALDVSIQAQIINLLQRLQDRLGLTYLFIAHDLSVVRHISDRIAVMYLGRIVEVAQSRELNTKPLHPYTVALLSAIPIPDPAVEATRRRIILAGDVPSPVNPPSGCRFHTRCWLRTRLGNPERCTTEDPALRSLVVGHEVACHFAEAVAGSVEQMQAVGAQTAARAGAPGGTSAARGSGAATPGGSGAATPGGPWAGDATTSPGASTAGGAPPPTAAPPGTSSPPRPPGGPERPSA